MAPRQWVRLLKCRMANSEPGLSHHRLLSGFAILLQPAALAVFVVSLLRFFDAPNVTAQIRWGGLAGLMVLFVASIKMWFWLELHTNRVLREVKRIELLLVTRGAAK